METREKIRRYIIEASMCDDGKLTDEDLIFKQGLLDSMGLLFLVQFIKEELDIVTEDQELINENFESLNAIVSFVEARLAAKKALPAQKMTF